jgi:hypothetical protein
MTSYCPKRPRDLSHLVGESLQYCLLGEIGCDEDHFGKPGRRLQGAQEKKFGPQYQGWVA